MSSQYYLQINSTKAPIADWEITSAILNINNQASDEFLFTTTQSFDINSTVNLYRDNTRIFAGIIYKAPEDESALEEASTTYQALSPWYDLEEIIYQQNWTCLDANTSYTSYSALKSHVILGQDSSGYQIDIGTQITNILSYAKGAAANLSIGNIGTSNPMLYDETKDISCAQAIKRVLKWIPDAITYFDYSQDMPTLHIARRSALDTKTININTDDIKSYKITPRSDLSISGVEIKYEKTHSLDNETWNTLELDTYPVGFDSQCKKALIMTVELEGYKAITEERQITCEELKTDSLEWWQEKIPALRDVEKLEIKEVNREHPTYGYELISGSIPDWAISNADAKPDEMEVVFSYSTGACTYAEKRFSHKFIATNSSSKTYSQTVVSDYEEPTPANLAQSLYEALNPLNYDATIVLYNANIEDFVGKKINLLNSKTDYSTMQCAVMNLSYNLFADTLTIKAGVPKQLYPANIAEIFRVNRTRSSSVNFASKSTGKTASTYKMSIADTFPKENTLSAEPLLAALKLGSSAELIKIDIDSNEIPDGLTMKVTKVLVAKDGEEAYAYILMTEPKTQAELDALNSENEDNSNADTDNENDSDLETESESITESEI